MLKFIRGKGALASAERIRVQKELFSFKRTITHGFPSKPSALSYSSKLNLIAIGTKSGALKVLGRPGVEFSGQHPKDDYAVDKILFVSKIGCLITLCEDNSLHLWQIKNSTATLELIKTYSLEGKLKKISSFALREDESSAYIGTEGGNVYTLDMRSFEMTEKIIYLDVVLQNGPENYKVNPGAVEAILEHPVDFNKLLIGYERGLIVLWDIEEQKTLKSFVNSQQLEDLSWVKGNTEAESIYFVSGHNDGSYIVWDVNKPDKPYHDANNPYGPYPCKRLAKVRIYNKEGGGGKPDDFLVVFNGGMPRASFGDHNTVSVMREIPKNSANNNNSNSEEEEESRSHVVYDLTSKIVDFAVIEHPIPRDLAGGTASNENGNGNEENEKMEPVALLILAEEEMVMVDLKEENWPIFQSLPYLNSLHPSAVTCFHHTTNVSREIFETLEKIGKESSAQISQISSSSNEWPILGGKSKEPIKRKELLISGHEDGSVRFWDSSGNCLTLLCKFSSSVLFNSDEIACDTKDEDDEEWPPFKKVGTFDPFSDDPKLAIKKLAFCPKTGVLSLGGTAGQVIFVNTLKKPEENSKLEVNACNLVDGKDGFVWKGHDGLRFCPKNNPNLNEDGRLGGGEGSSFSFNVAALLQVQPPAAITAIALEAASGVAAIGTAHGVVLYDFFRKRVIMSRSTLNPNDIMAAGDTPISRRKSIKKSLRESFRRLRKGRSQRFPGVPPGATIPSKSPSSANANNININTIQSPASAADLSKPVERAIEARSQDDAMSSMVRSVTFAKTFIISLQTTTTTLWVGSNSGTVYVYLVSVPGGEKRLKEDVICNIAKEIQLKHRAPVLSIITLDSTSSIIDSFSPQHDHLAPHKVLICSEEQIKIFTLPSLRPFGKLKLTAQEGSRIRKIGVSTFVSSADGNYSEKCVNCMTNQGDLYVITVPDLRKQITTSCLRREDISGISSFVFNESGEAFHLVSSSELQRISLSAKNITKPDCSVYIETPLEGLMMAKIVKNKNSEREIKVRVSVSPNPKGNALEILEMNENAQNEVRLLDEVIQEVGDITIDSVRDHLGNSILSASNINSSTSISLTSNNTASTGERLIDGGTLTAETNKNVSNNSNSNSIQVGVQNSSPSITESSTTTATTTSSTRLAQVQRAPLADLEETRHESEL